MKVLSDILLSQNNMEFVDYVNVFYGQGKVTHYDENGENPYQDDSIYGKEFFPSTGGVTKAEIILATKIRMLTNIELPFDGDSTDREIVRDIMAEAREGK